MGGLGGALVVSGSPSLPEAAESLRADSEAPPRFAAPACSDLPFAGYLLLGDLNG